MIHISRFFSNRKSNIYLAILSRHLFVTQHDVADFIYTAEQMRAVAFTGSATKLDSLIDSPSSMGGLFIKMGETPLSCNLVSHGSFRIGEDYTWSSTIFAAKIGIENYLTIIY